MQSQVKSLLPAGFYDSLGEDATKATYAIRKILDLFEEYGYQRVITPIMEFSKNLDIDSFHLLDPISNHMVEIRSDITIQIARIAATKLAQSPRPLRLAYSGEVMRPNIQDFFGRRQLTQAGIELIGENNLAAQTEVILLALKTLTNLGIRNLTIDLCAPKLLMSIISNEELSAAIAKKDSAIIRKIAKEQNLPDDLQKFLQKAIMPIFPLEEIVAFFPANKHIENLQILSRKISSSYQDVSINIDPLEYHGFEYHDMLGFSIFSSNLPTEIARGGSYHLETQEKAVGFTLYIDRVQRLINTPIGKKKVMIAYGEQFLDSDHIKIPALSPADDLAMLATEHGCDYIFEKNQLIKFEI